MTAGSRAMLRACEELGARRRAHDRRHVGVVIDDGFATRRKSCCSACSSRTPMSLLVGGGASDIELDPRSIRARPRRRRGRDRRDARRAVPHRRAVRRAPLALVRADRGAHQDHEARRDRTQRALEIDGKPAAQRYADILGVSVDELEFGKPNGFARRPTALRVGKEYFIRAPWKPLPDGSRAVRKLARGGLRARADEARGHCRLDPQVLHRGSPAAGQEPERGAAVPLRRAHLVRACDRRERECSRRHSSVAPPCVGFDVHFEIYCGFHINTTLTSLVFGAT